MNHLVFRPHSLLTSLLLSLLLITLSQASKTSAQDRSMPPIKALEADAAKTQRLIERLGSPRFADRLDATKQLEVMGAAAHAELGEAVQSGDSESASRAMELLRKATRSSKPSISESAIAELDSIADSKHLRSSEARRALEPQTPSEPQGMRRFPGFGGMPRAMPGGPGAMAPRQQLQFNFTPLLPQGFGGPQGQGNLRISIRTINGVRDIKVTKNNETFGFRDVNGGLQVVTPDAKGGTTTRVYKDADELKQKDAKAYEMYRQAGGDRRRAVGRLKAPFGNLDPFGNPVPFGNPLERPQLRRDRPAEPPAARRELPKPSVKKSYKKIDV